MKTIKKINWIVLSLWFILLFLFAGIGMSLPPTINVINNLKPDSLYGYWASYVVSMGLFWMMVKDFKLTYDKEEEK